MEFCEICCQERSGDDFWTSACKNHAICLWCLAKILRTGTHKCPFCRAPLYEPPERQQNPTSWLDLVRFMGNELNDVANGGDGAVNVLDMLPPVEDGSTPFLSMSGGGYIMQSLFHGQPEFSLHIGSSQNDDEHAGAMNEENVPYTELRDDPEGDPEGDPENDAETDDDPESNVINAPNHHPHSHPEYEHLDLLIAIMQSLFHDR